MLSAFFAYLKITDFIRHKTNNPGKLSFIEYFQIYGSRYLRLAPTYYVVFFTGWFIGPYLATGPWWYTFQMDFCDCQHYWWSVLTMTINEFPGFMVANEGCYYWGWYVACDMQLFLVVPIFVYILEFKLQNSKILANIIILVIICGGNAISAYVIYHNDQSAGLFAP